MCKCQRGFLFYPAKLYLEIKVLDLLCSVHFCSKKVSMQAWENFNWSVHSQLCSTKLQELHNTVWIEVFELIINLCIDLLWNEIVKI